MIKRALTTASLGVLLITGASTASAATLQYDVLNPKNIPGYEGIEYAFGFQLREHTSPLPHLLKADKISYAGYAIDLILTLDTDAHTVNLSGTAKMENKLAFDKFDRDIRGDRTTFNGLVDVDFTWTGVQFSSTDTHNPAASQRHPEAGSSGSITYREGPYDGQSFNFFPKASDAGYTLRLQTLADHRIVLDGWFDLLGFHGNADFVFQAVPIPTTPTEVPEPASVALMLTGLCGMLHRRKKKEQKNSF